jgi:hypothetical protein
MNPFNPNDPTRQTARAWSAKLGSLAAAQPANRRDVTVPQHSGAVPTRLAAVLTHLRQRAERRQHAADQLRAEEFMAP